MYEKNALHPKSGRNKVLCSIASARRAKERFPTVTEMDCVMEMDFSKFCQENCARILKSAGNETKHKKRNEMKVI